MGQVSQLEDEEDRRNDALSGGKPIERKTPLTAKIFDIIHRAPARALRAARIPGKRIQEARRRRIEREEAQRAWWEEIRLIRFEEDNLIYDPRDGSVRPIDPTRPMIDSWLSKPRRGAG
jgi:hypothetical protein